MKKSKNGWFIAENGEENSITILRAGMPNVQIGFISSDGEFFIDSNGEQILIHPEHLIELHNFIQLLVNTPSHLLK